MLIFEITKRTLFPAALWLLICSRSFAEPVLIHHPQLRGENFSTGSLVRIYAMQKRAWSDNTPVKVFTLPNNSNLYKEFVTDYLKMQPYQLDRLWHRLVFSGTGTRPEEVSSISEMLEKVKNTPGAIGYVDSSLVQNIDNSLLMVNPNE